MEKSSITRNICISAAVIIGAFLFFKYLLRMLLPFIIAFFIAYVFRTPLELLHKRTKLKRGVLSAMFVIFAVLICGFILFLLGSRLLSEVERFAFALSENSDKYIQSFFDFIDTLTEKLPFIDQIGGDLRSAVSDAVKSMLTAATSELPGMIARAVGMLPEILLFTVILIMASYYFCADPDIYRNISKKYLPKRIYGAVLRFKRSLKETGISYLKSCAVLLFITYIELLIGFLMLGVQYAFTLALVVSAVDMLPILGVGTVLVPWALWCWIAGDSYTAFGLLIIFGIVSVVRRFIEPRVIGSGIGLSPIMTLFSMYVGFRLFGFTGLIFSPFAAILIIQFIASLRNNGENVN